jgi:hypothetical protein
MPTFMGNFDSENFDLILRNNCSSNRCSQGAVRPGLTPTCEGW